MMFVNLVENFDFNFSHEPFFRFASVHFVNLLKYFHKMVQEEMIFGEGQ